MTTTPGSGAIERTDRIRVLRIIARMNIGGPAIHATLLADGLEQRGYQTYLVAGSTTREEGNYLDLHGRRLANFVELASLGREIDPGRDVSAYRDLRRIIRDFRPHIVHTHTAKAGFLGRLAARRAGVPIIVHTFHGHVLRGYFSLPKEWLFVQAERSLAKVTTRLITVSAQVRDELLARGIGRAEQFEVIRLGFDLTPFATCEQRAGTIRNELGLTRATRVVAIVARLVPIKAHEVFLEMAVRVTATIPDVVFLVVGDGERRAELEQLARTLGIHEKTRFLGWRADLDRVYADCDVVVLTSRNEGSPVALIEAMASGRPVVATRVGGVEELVGEVGLLADVDDSAALARAVSQLLADPERASRLGQAARQRVVTTYGKDRLVDDVDGLYRRLLTHGSSVL